MSKFTISSVAAAMAFTVSLSTVAQETRLFSRQLSFDTPSVTRQQAQSPVTIGRQAQILRAVSLTEDLNNYLSVGDFVSMELDGEYIQLRITQVKNKDSETTYIDGASLDGNASLSMVRLKNRISASIRIHNRGYLLTPDGEGTYNVSRFIDDQVPVDAHPLPSGSELKQQHQNLEGNTSSPIQSVSANNPEVSVVVAYTDKLAAEVGDVEAYLALMEKDTNDSYIASNISARVNITHSYQTGYRTTGDMSEDNSVLLNESTSSWLPSPNPLAPNGFGVELKSFRDQHQADVMVFLADQNASSPWAGWAGQIGTDAESALFTMSSWGTFKNTFAHELGHLYGARHDNDPTQTPFAYGHGFCNEGKTWHTMMAITSCGSRLNVWSNPNQIYEGEAGGTAEQNDNARVHNERGPVMAALRTSEHLSPVTTIAQASVTPGDLSVSFEGTANDSDGSIVSTLWDFGDGVYHNTPYAQGTSTSHTYSFPGSYTVRFTATDNEGLIHSVTQEIEVSATPGSSYCAVKGNNAIYQYIRNVAVNGTSVDSGRRQYTDHTQASTFDLYTNTDTGIALQQGTRSNDFGPYSAYWAVYVDLNQNNSFDDPGELLHFSTPRNDASREPVLASITIPDSALAGLTRMRVIQSNTLRGGETTLNACGDFSFGEAEDFTVNIIKQSSPADFSFSFNSETMTVDFDTSADNIASLEWDFGDGLYSQDNTSNSFNPNHRYAFGGKYVVTLTVTLTNGETYTLTKVIEVTPPAGQDYCRAYGNQPAFQYTANVTLNGNSVSSGSSNYSYHNSSVLGAVHGSNTISVLQGATGSEASYNANWRVYIDLNQNGNFENSESVWYWVGVNTANTITRSFTIPDSALTGSTRMRVIQSFEDVNTPCGMSRWGEVEDFDIRILAENPADFTASVIPGDLAVQFTDNSANNSDITALVWDFGDSIVNSSHTSAASNPNHRYEYAGDFDASLTVTLQDGVKFQSQQTLSVSGDAYCLAWGKSNTQWTSNVRLGSINNASDKSAFSYFDNTGFSIKKGEETEMGFTHDSGGPWLANWAVYIDLNQNYRFDDPGEMLVQTSATSFDEIVGSISIPESAISGNTRMRVMQSFELEDGIVPACGAFEWGEVEDYLISITDDGQPQSDLLNGIALTDISVARDEQQTFSFFVPQGATDVSVLMTAGTGDPDLYVKFEDTNTTTDWDCRPYIGGNSDETCGSDVLTQSGGTYYVTVRGWSASDNVTLTGSYTDSVVVIPEPNTCESIAPQTRGNLTNDQAICLGSSTVYVAIWVTPNQSVLNITSRGGDGDASIYQSTSRWPQSTVFDNSAETANTSEESIEIQNPSSGWHYMMVSGQGNGTELLVSFQ